MSTPGFSCLFWNYCFQALHYDYIVLEFLLFCVTIEFYRFLRLGLARCHLLSRQFKFWAFNRTIILTSAPSQNNYIEILHLSLVLDVIFVFISLILAAKLEFKKRFKSYQHFKYDTSCRTWQTRLPSNDSSEQGKFMQTTF